MKNAAIHVTKKHSIFWDIRIQWNEEIYGTVTECHFHTTNEKKAVTITWETMKLTLNMENQKPLLMGEFGKGEADEIILKEV